MQRSTVGTLQQLHPTGLWCQTGQRCVICCCYCLLVDACPCNKLLTSKAFIRSHPCASLKRSTVSVCPTQEVAEAEAGKFSHFTRRPTTGAQLAFTTQLRPMVTCCNFYLLRHVAGIISRNTAVEVGAIGSSRGRVGGCWFP